MNPRTAYRQDLVRGAQPVRLVVLLYEQIIDDLRQAAQAMEQNQIERRTQKINHAIVVIGYLESSLNKRAGGEVALQLERYYQNLRQYLVEAHQRESPAIVSQQIVDLLALREAWSEVESAETAARSAFAARPKDLIAQSSGTNWSG